MPAVKISARLELKENISFMDGHELKPDAIFQCKALALKFQKISQYANGDSSRKRQNEDRCDEMPQYRVKLSTNIYNVDTATLKLKKNLNQHSGKTMIT